jgi:hypothetical protein
MRSGCHNCGISTRSACIWFPETNCLLEGNKSTTLMFYHVPVSGADLPLDSFEELAMSLFDQLFNFAHWLTQNREAAEDLVQEDHSQAGPRLLRGSGKPCARCNSDAL